MSDKLSGAQRQLLVEVSLGEDRCSNAYRPAQNLVAKGLLEWVSENRLSLTDAGRLALVDGRPA